MTPYYDEQGITLFCGDVLQVLDAGVIPEIGITFTSPPYNIGGSHRAGTAYSKLREGYGKWSDALTQPGYEAWQRNVLYEIWELTRNDGAIFYNHKPQVRQGECWLPLKCVPDIPLRQVLIWDRSSGFNRQQHYFTPSHEWIMVFAKPGWRIKRNAGDDVWRVPFGGFLATTVDAGIDHPAPFPVALVDRALEPSDPNLVVFDPFAGSGTTLLAAKRAGRRAIGIEIEEKYCEVAVQRLAQGVLEFQ